MRPYLDVKDQPDRVVLELAMESILSAQAHEHLQQAFGERAESLFGEALTILAIVAMEGSATHRSLHYRVSMHAKDLSTLLRSLYTDGFLSSTGRGSGTTYYLNDSSKKLADSSKQTLATFDGKGVSSAQNLATPGEKEESLPENLASSPQNLATFNESLASLTKLTKLQKLLLLAAANGWHTPAELAAATSRSANYLRSHMIPALVSTRLLIRKYDEANHPNQAYRTAQWIEESLISQS